MFRRLPEVLLQKGLLTEAQVARVRELEQQTERRLDQVLLSSGFISEEDLLRVFAELMGFDYVDLSKTEPQPAAIAKTPAKYVFKNKVFPISCTDSVLFVATNEPFEILSLDELEAITGLVVEPVFATGKEIARQIKQHYGVGGETVGDMVGQQEDSADIAEGDEEDVAQSASVVRLVNEILSEAVRERASDIHIEPGEDGLQIRYRVDGMLQSQNVPPEIHRFQSAIASRLKIMAKLNIAEKRKPQDGRIKLKVDDRDVDLRVSIIPMLHGEGIVMRILDKGKMVYDLRRIGMDEAIHREFGKLIKLPHGIILVTGPTGSGKSTTLYSALAEIKDESTKIITVEDPVEYQMPGISQIQVNHKVGLDFAAGLRSILRHDPDVVLIGEIRDFETAQIAIQAAMTGHLVFSTLHTNDAAGAFARLVDMGVEPFLVSSTVMGILAQRLVRGLCQECREQIPLRATDVPTDFPIDEVEHIWRAVGCDRCRQVGYAGRSGIYELLVSNEAIQQLVVNRASSTAVKNAAITRGMATLRQSGWARVIAGTTTVEEVVRVTKDDERQAAPSERAEEPDDLPSKGRPVILSMQEG